MARLLTYNRSSPRAHYLLDNVLYLRTIIVIADIYRGLYSPAKQSEDHFTPRI